MAETVADQWLGVINLADINTLFLCIVVEISNSFSAWEVYAGLVFFWLVAQRLVFAGYTVLCSQSNSTAGILILSQAVRQQDCHESKSLWR